MVGIEIGRVLAEINLFWVWWSIGLVLVWAVEVEISLIFGRGLPIDWFWSEHRDWLSFLSGWSTLTSFQCEASNLTWIQFRDRNLFVLFQGIEKNLVLVSGSELTWILCDHVRPQIDTESWQRCVGYVLDDRLVNVVWVAQVFIFFKVTKEVRVSNSGHGWLSNSVVYPL